MIFESEFRFITVLIKIFIPVNAEKLIIHFSSAYSLDIDQMLYGNILSSYIFPSGTTTQGK